MMTAWNSLERWRKIEDTDLSISSHGNIFNNKLQRKRERLYTVVGGYSLITITRLSTGKTFGAKIHRLVATAFIENPMNRDVVDHIDGNRLNNCSTNLRWTTQRQNCTNNRAKGYYPKASGKFQVNYPELIVGGALKRRFKMVATEDEAKAMVAEKRLVYQAAVKAFEDNK